jgi:hypothetical protein
MMFTGRLARKVRAVGRVDFLFCVRAGFRNFCGPTVSITAFQENDSTTAEKQGTSMAETVSKYAEIMNGAKDASVHPVIIEGLQATKQMYQKAADNNIPIIVDGELRNTYFSLHAQTMAAALLYNAVQDENTLVYGTFQCYLKVRRILIQKTLTSFCTTFI